MTNRDLAALVRRYNRRYFAGRLPNVDVRFARIDPGAFGICVVFAGTPEIRIAREIKGWGKLVKMTLLHELVHVALPKRVEHGPRFQAEMLRLAKAHAFDGLW